jgi:hypothetical protein
MRRRSSRLTLLAVAATFGGHTVFAAVSGTPSVAEPAQGGTELWSRVEEGPWGSDSAFRVVASPDSSRVFVPGYSEG